MFCVRTCASKKAVLLQHVCHSVFILKCPHLCRREARVHAHGGRSLSSLSIVASPAVVAQSALNGYISAPKEFKRGKLTLKASIGDWKPSAGASQTPAGESSDEPSTSSREASASIDLIDGFPRSVEGEIVFCDADNINTDLCVVQFLTVCDRVEFHPEAVHVTLKPQLLCPFLRNDVLGPHVLRQHCLFRHATFCPTHPASPRIDTGKCYKYVPFYRSGAMLRQHFNMAMCSWFTHTWMCSEKNAFLDSPTLSLSHQLFP